MAQTVDDRVFGVGDDEYRWSDVEAAARAWGDWAALESGVRRILACIERLRDTPEAPGDAEVEEAANEFRYARDLLSAEDMEGWLDARNLTSDEWMEHVLGALAVSRCDGLDPDEPRPDVPDAGVERFARIEAACGGSRERWARKLAGRAAIAAAEDDSGVSASDESVPERLARLDAAFERFRERALTPAAIRDQVAVRHLDWIRIRGSRASFGSEAAAREAVLCMKEDRRPLREVAADAGREADDVTICVDEIDPAARDRFLGARVQGVVGPIPAGDAFEVFEVLEKILPSAQDAQIRDRAKAEILRRAVDREIADRVRWAAGS